MGKGYSPEQIIKRLRQAEGRLASGSTIPEVARELGVSEATFHRWRKRYGGMSTSEAKRLKELEKENARLKKLVAEKELDIDILNAWCKLLRLPPQQVSEGKTRTTELLIEPDAEVVQSYSRR